MNRQAGSAEPSGSIVVRLFAGAKQRVGAERVTVELSAGATVADLRLALVEAHPALADLLPRALFAIDCEYVADQRPLTGFPEIACIPPVSGG
ncbi:MAG: MoaD/ThiS family protein [Planctomycetota bacterium]